VAVHERGRRLNDVLVALASLHRWNRQMLAECCIAPGRQTASRLNQVPGTDGVAKRWLAALDGRRLSAPKLGAAGLDCVHGALLEKRRINAAVGIGQVFMGPSPEGLPLGKLLLSPI
jgi:hypothetical protein